MKKYFIASDIHSFYDEWMKALADKGFDINNENHTIVVLGDLLDRGPKAKECLNFVNNLPNDRKILIRGNHEDLLETCMKHKMFAWHDYSNGTVNTVEQLTGKDLTTKRNMDLDAVALMECTTNSDLQYYLNSTLDYYEIGDNIFCHGWIPYGLFEDKEKPGIVNYGVLPNWRDASRRVWEAARWENGMRAWNSGTILEGKTIYCGHYHTSWGHYYIDESCEDEFDGDADFSPFIKEGIVAIDACTAHTHKVNVITLDIEE